MARVEPLVADWLQAEALWAVAEDANVSARWGDSARSSERMTALALQADAAAEGDRVLAFRGFPVVQDEAELAGAFVDYIGRVITIRHADLGYAAGVDVFVLTAEDDHKARRSRIRFLRRLT
ncbi:MAG: hypothetical protein WBA68_03780 [Alteraurantiacibacter sp.]